MKKEILEFQSEVCKTFANPRRLTILDLLRTQDLSAGDITAARKIESQQSSACCRHAASWNPEDETGRHEHLLPNGK
jgi:hypothetical protein